MGVRNEFRGTARTVVQAGEVNGDITMTRTENHNGPVITGNGNHVEYNGDRMTVIHGPNFGEIHN